MIINILKQHGFINMKNVLGIVKNNMKAQFLWTAIITSMIALMAIVFNAQIWHTVFGMPEYAIELMIGRDNPLGWSHIGVLFVVLVYAVWCIASGFLMAAFSLMDKKMHKLDVVAAVKYKQPIALPYKDQLIAYMEQSEAGVYRPTNTEIRHAKNLIETGHRMMGV